MRNSLPAWSIAIALLCSGIWLVWLCMGHISGRASLLDRLETVLLDIRIQVAGPRHGPSSVAIVAIDDATIAFCGQYPLPRSRLADIVTGIRRAGAKALAIDMLLTGQTGHDEDKQLASVLSSLPVVIAKAAQFTGENSGARQIPAPSAVIGPLPAFGQQAMSNLVNIVTDAGGTPRFIPMLFRSEAGFEPSFDLQAVSLYLGGSPEVTSEGLRFQNRLQPLDFGWHLPLNYYGSRTAVQTVSASQLLRGEDLKQELDGKLVFLGVTVTASGDRFATPFDPIFPGVEVLATGAANLMDGSALIRDSTVRRVDAAAAVLMTLGGLVAVATMPLAVAWLIFLAMLAGWLAITMIGFSHFYWFSGALPIAASLSPFIILAIVRQVFDRYELRKLTEAQAALSQFQAPALARRIAEDPFFLVTPREQDAAILFIDLAGYTGLSERIGPTRTRDVLKAFHTIVVNETNRYGGVVMDFMGDGAMIAFGVPEPGTQDAQNAVDAAFALGRAVTDWISQAGPASEITAVRVGAHYGAIVLSRLGHDAQQQIAATGDCVNAANRLQEIAKSHEAVVVLSSTLISLAPVAKRPAYETVAVRGRQKPMQVALWRVAEINATAA